MAAYFTGAGPEDRTGVSVSPSPRVVKFGLRLSAPLFHHSIIPSPSPEFWILALATDYFF